jgi:hypothetical protein
MKIRRLQKQANFEIRKFSERFIRDELNHPFRDSVAVIIVVQRKIEWCCSAFCEKGLDIA